MYLREAAAKITVLDSTLVKHDIRSQVHFLRIPYVHSSLAMTFKLFYSGFG